MAGLFEDSLDDSVSILDPGAGAGTLTASLIERLFGGEQGPSVVKVAGYEIDRQMARYLQSTLAESKSLAMSHGASLSFQVLEEDFIESATSALLDSTAKPDLHGFTHCIMNPPYKKIRSDSEHRKLLRTAGIEAGNLYSGFLALAIGLLREGGQLVAIVPRSFCNGPYFRPFRKLLLEETSIRHLHVFESRKEAFKAEQVLQENVIISVVKGGPQTDVAITSSTGSTFEALTFRKVPFSNVVNPDDSEEFIYISPSEADQLVADRMAAFSHHLSDLGVGLSTGPVVDFRLKEHLSEESCPGSVPLVYPGHMAGNFVTWPKLGGKKSNAIMNNAATAKWLMPNGWYVLTRRFSSKEEKRRIVASIHSPQAVPGDAIGFENHLNVFHSGKAGMDPDIARGLAVYLNSSLVDRYFRTFSGHTQVNATDLRMLHYPSLAELRCLGEAVTKTFPDQQEVDRLLEELVACSWVLDVRDGSA